MAISDSDVGLLTTSAQIFASNHTLPQIRAIHKALYGQVEDKKARLRSQVGGSYRELLGTADTIVQMRGDMEGAQATLAGMGARCGRAVVGNKVAALATFVDNDDDQSALGLAARAQLLEACARTAGRLLSRSGTAEAAEETSRAQGRQKRPAQQRSATAAKQARKSWGERLIMAAKILVLSRLLISSLGEAAGRPKRPTSLQDASILISIEASKRTISHLRRRLRNIVEALERSVGSAASPADNSTLDGDGDGLEGEDDGDDRRGSNGVGGAAGTDRDDLLRALCAHSLASTSGTRDVLWQLLHVRSQAMALAFDMSDDDDSRTPQQGTAQDAGASWKADNVLRGLALYTKTLLDVQALLPRRLPEALLDLKRRALLDDEALRSMEGLGLDVYARWCGEDVQYFKPYLRHDDLDAAQARDMLAKWAERGAEVLLSGLQRALEQQEQEQQQQPHHRHHHLGLNAIVDLRTRVLQLWIHDSSAARGIDPSELLDKMRAVFSQQMRQVVSTKVSKLRLVGSEVASTLASWQDGVTDQHANLWGSSGSGGDDDAGDTVHGALLDMDLSEGSIPFVRNVVSRMHGRSDTVSRAVTSYVTWHHVIDDAAVMIDQLRRQRWDNDVADIVEDEETIAERQRTLSRQDPQALRDRLEAALATAFQDLDALIGAEWAKVVAAADVAKISTATKGHMAMYLVRVLREIRSRRPTAAAAGTAATAAVDRLGLSIIPALHAAIAAVVATQTLDQFTSTVLTRKTVAGRPLWEAGVDDSSSTGAAGIALPAMPSPGVFKFVRELSAAMGRAGMDLWSPAAVAELKQHVGQQLSKQWTELLQTADYLQESAVQEETKESEGKKEKPTNGDADEKDESSEEKPADEPAPSSLSPQAALSDEQRRDLLLQWLFDIAWLHCILGGDKGQIAHLKDLGAAVYKRAGLPEGEASNGSGGSKTPQQRIAKTAQEYWKKTSLLFGLLA